ncbi:hypothetical protein GW17_00016289 [Ensete ventricosum]|nr:hypothetical protein GW17_00016289 [Ensete ventricosum]
MSKLQESSKIHGRYILGVPINNILGKEEIGRLARVIGIPKDVAGAILAHGRQRSARNDALILPAIATAGVARSLEACTVRWWWCHDDPSNTTPWVIPPEPETMLTVGSVVRDQLHHQIIHIGKNKSGSGEVVIELREQVPQLGIVPNGEQVGQADALVLFDSVDGLLVRDASDGSYVRHHDLSRVQRVQPLPWSSRRGRD